MPEDVVARLRTCRLCHNTGTLGGQPCPRCANSIHREAADEVVFLRERDKLRRALEKEVVRLQKCLERIAEHHDAQMVPTLSPGELRYHQARRDVVLYYLREIAHDPS